MYLVQILLPLYDNRGLKLSPKLFRNVEKKLSVKFKGLTAYTRVPAKGFWKKGGKIKQDQIVTYEVMVPRLQRSWWKQFGAQEEKAFRQNEIVVRAQKLEML